MIPANEIQKLFVTLPPFIKLKTGSTNCLISYGLKTKNYQK